jgi:phytol kinase
MLSILTGQLGLNEALAGALIALIWSYACLSLAGYLKGRRGVRTGYTRKIFHLLIFTSAIVAHALGGFLGVCIFGAMVSIVVGHAIILGPGNSRYQALAREQDKPYRTKYIIIPYFATLIGGMVSNIFFGPIAVVGFLVGGLGDAAGEPAGTRWGNHPYVRRSGRAMVTKTFEGSFAVLLASAVALLIGVAITPELHFGLRTAIAIPAIAMVCTLVEAFSPRGWDNVPMQIVPTILTTLLLTK